MRSLLPVLVAGLSLTACRSEKHEQPSSDVRLTSASSTPVVAPATSAVEPPAAAPKTAAPPEPEPPPPAKLAAGKTTVLEGAGLTITPAFAYTIEDRSTHWTLRATDKALKGGDFYLMRKMFSADAPLGSVVVCKNPKEGAPKKEADGSFTYKCRADSEGNGTWFARLVPTKDPTYPTVQCVGSSTSPKTLAVIEATCRSIKKQ